MIRIVPDVLDADGVAFDRVYRFTSWPGATCRVLPSLKRTVMGARVAL